MWKLRKRKVPEGQAIYKDDLSSGEEDGNKDDDEYVSAAEDKVEDDQDNVEGDEDHGMKSLELIMERAKEDESRQIINIGRVRMTQSDIDNQRKKVGKYLDFFNINKDKSIAPNTRRFNSKKEGYKKQGTIMLDDDIFDDDDDDDDDLSSDSGKDKKVKKIKKLKKNLPLTENDEELYPQVRTLIEYGWFKKERPSGFNKKSQLSSFIDINKPDMDYEKVYLEDGEYLEKHLTEDDFVYFNRTDRDFPVYYLERRKSFAGISLGGEKDPKDYTIPYELKIMFLACKLCKLKTEFWSQKYHDINNKLRDYMNWENTPLKNLESRYIQADPKHNPEQNLHPQVSGREQRRQTRMKERHTNRKIMVENDMRKLFK
jgi:hypothetical protein